jgi:hypothetical protein
MNNHFEITYPLKCGHALILLLRVSDLVAENLRTNFRLQKCQEIKQTEMNMFYRSIVALDYKKITFHTITCFLFILILKREASWKS